MLRSKRRSMRQRLRIRLPRERRSSSTARCPDVLERPETVGHHTSLACSATQRRRRAFFRREKALRSYRSSAAIWSSIFGSATRLLIEAADLATRCISPVRNSDTRRSSKVASAAIAANTELSASGNFPAKATASSFSSALSVAEGEVDAAKPCLEAFLLEIALPFSEFGPVLFSALRRLASVRLAIEPGESLLIARLGQLSRVAR